MRGTPFLRLLLILGLFALAAIPLVRLTWKSSAEANPQTSHPENVGALHPVQLSITAARPWQNLRLICLGQVVEEIPGPSQLHDTEISLPLPDEGVDLQVEAAWENTGSPAALRLQASVDGQTVSEHTWWGEDGVNDVLLIRKPPSTQP